jgi:hypothetical protein
MTKLPIMLVIGARHFITKNIGTSIGINGAEVTLKK